MSNRRILESWKEIAAHLNRTCRTCRTWEKELGLPVHRLSKTPRARVYAYQEELDEWLHNKFEKSHNGIRPSSSIAATLLSHVYGKEIISEEPSIAVLPFIDLSSDKDQEYFCDGLVEHIINSLAHLKKIKIIARTSSFALKDKKLDVLEVSRMLGVQTLLEGSVQKVGERIRIFVQLINCPDSNHIWSKHFDSDIKDIFATQDKISLAVVNKLRVKFSEDEREKIIKHHTEDPEAYQLYLKGKHSLRRIDRPGTQEGLEYLRKSLELDPKFIPALVGIATCYTLKGTMGIDPPEEIFSRAKKIITQALKIDSHFDEAQTIAAMLAFLYDWDWKESEARFRLAIESNPQNAFTRNHFGWFLFIMQRFEESLAQAKKALELEPLSGFNYVLIGTIYSFTDRWEECFKEFQKALQLDPQMGIINHWLGINCLHHGKYKEALKNFKIINRVEPLQNFGLFWTGVVHARQGHIDKTHHSLNQLLERRKTQYVSASFIAFLYDYVGQRNKTYEWLERAYKEKDHCLAYIKVTMVPEKLRQDQRFLSFLGRMNLGD
jgi:TolB-like protein/Tfp pilus assembly protein PilF